MQLEYSELDDHLRKHPLFLKSLDKFIERHRNSLIPPPAPVQAVDHLTIVEEGGKIKAIHETESGKKEVEDGHLNLALVRTIVKESDPIYLITFDQEYENLKILSYPNKIISFNFYINQKEAPNTLSEQLNPYFGLSPEESLIYGCHKDSNNIVIINWNCGTHDYNQLKGHKGIITGFAVSRFNYDIVFTCSLDRTIKAWSVAAQLPIFNLEMDLDGFHSIILNKDESKFFVGGGNGKILVYNLNMRRVEKVFDTCHEVEVTKLIFSPEAKTLFACSNDGRISAWNPDTYELVRVYEKPEESNNQLRAIIFSPDGNYVIGGGLDGKIYVWEVQTGVLKYVTEAHDCDITCFTFDKNTGLMYTAGLDGQVKAWDFSLKKLPVQPKTISFNKLNFDVLKLNLGPEVRIQDIHINTQDLPPWEGSDDEEYEVVVEADGKEVLTFEFAVDSKKKETMEVEQPPQTNEQKEVERMFSPEGIKGAIKVMQECSIPIEKIRSDPKFWDYLVDMIEEKHFQLCMASYLEDGQPVHCAFLRNANSSDKDFDKIIDAIKELYIGYEKIKE